KAKIREITSPIRTKRKRKPAKLPRPKNYLELTANLAKSPNIRAFFTDLLRNFAGKFARIIWSNLSRVSSSVVPV
ncbi:13153_t:CDS:2, partial [Gigaspora margarita]